jgi:hypothetical protein
MDAAPQEGTEGFQGTPCEHRVYGTADAGSVRARAILLIGNAFSIRPSLSLVRH